LVGIPAGMLIPNNPEKITTVIELKYKLVSFSQTFYFQFIKTGLLVTKYSYQKLLRLV
jgi:hypothetical protein